MTDPDKPLTVTIAVGSQLADSVESALSETDCLLQSAGPARGAAEIVAAFVAIVPSIASLVLLLEKLRRLHLPRTIIVVGHDNSVDIYEDDSINDGRVLVLQSGAPPVDLTDREITLAILSKALQRRNTLDE
jgi:hypothetical protein